MNEITVTVHGYVATEPRHTVTPDGTARTSFRVGSTASYYDRELSSWVDRTTTFLSVVCWRTLALNTARSLVKGQPVVVHGTLTVREWERDSGQGLDVEVSAVSVGHDLRRGSSAFTKGVRPETAAATEATQGTAVPTAAATAEGGDGAGEGGEVAA